MTSATNLEELQRLSQKVTGKESTADSIADALAEIADGYSGGGGGGAAIESAVLYPDSAHYIQGGKIVLSDGTSVAFGSEYIPEFSVTSKAGTEAGTTKLTINNKLGSGNSYRYGIDITPSKPAIGQDMSELTAWDGVSAISVDDSALITVVEVDANNKAVKAGAVSAVIKY